MQTFSSRKTLISDADDFSFLLLLSFARKPLQSLSVFSADTFDRRPKHVKVRLVITAVRCRNKESKLDRLDFVGDVVHRSGKEASKVDGLIVRALCFD